MPSAAGAAVGVASVTLASRVLGFAREAALAAVFGASRASDAHLVATVIPSFLVMAVNNALVTVGIPVLSEYLHRPERRPRLEALGFLLAGTVYAAACRALRVREMALVWELARGVLGRAGGPNRQA